MTYINTNFYQQIALSRYSNVVSSCWRLPLAASAQQYCVDF